MTTVGSKASRKMTMKYPKKKTYKKNKTSMYSLKRELSNIKKTVYGAIERKQNINALNLPGISTTPLIFLLNDIDEGDSESQRTGLTINPRRHDMFLSVNAESGQTNEFRCIVFRWFDDTAPTISDILYSNTGGIFTGYNYLNIPVNWVKKPKYQILADERFSATSGTETENMMFSFKKYFKKGSKITYSGSSGGSIESGQMFCIIMSDSAVVPHPDLQGYSRLQYLDA